MKHITNKVSRRQFMAKAAAVSALPIVAACENAARLPLGSTANNGNPGSPAPKAFEDLMPKRTLGKTGLQVSMLGFGCGSVFKGLADGVWQPIMEKALELGINFFDTASEYGTEERLGEYLPLNRDKMYVATKLNSRDYDGAKAEFEGSLSRMKTSFVDLLMVHALSSSESFLEIEQGVWKYLNECKTSGSAKYIGFSTHDNLSPSAEFINNFAPDVATLAMSVTGYAQIRNIALPAAHAVDVGVIAILALRNLITPTRTPANLFAAMYAWEDKNYKPMVASITVGHDSLSQLIENICTVRGLYGRGCPTGVING